MLRVPTDENALMGGPPLTDSSHAGCPTFTHQRLATNTEYRMLDVIVAARNPLILNSPKSKTNALYPRIEPASTASAVFRAPSYSRHGGRVPVGHALTITNPSGKACSILYTLDGSDPCLTGGAVSPGALTYSAPVFLTVPVAVRTLAYLSGVW